MCSNSNSGGKGRKERRKGDSGSSSGQGRQNKGLGGQGGGRREGGREMPPYLPLPPLPAYPFPCPVTGGEDMGDRGMWWLKIERNLGGGHGKHNMALSLDMGHDMTGGRAGQGGVCVTPPSHSPLSLPATHCPSLVHPTCLYSLLLPSCG